MSSLSETQVERIASLARIKLSKIELERYSRELSSILGYVDQLGQADTQRVKTLGQIAGLRNVWQGDKPQNKQCLSQSQVLQNAPVKKDGFFRVRTVFSKRSKRA